MTDGISNNNTYNNKIVKIWIPLLTIVVVVVVVIKFALKHLQKRFQGETTNFSGWLASDDVRAVKWRPVWPDKNRQMSIKVA